MFGIDVASALLERIARHAQLVGEWNDRAGLTTVIDPVGMSAKHYLDSLALLEEPAWREARSAVDVGSGAGFPGMVLALALPDVRFTLVEAVRKKADFLRMAAKELGVDAEVVHARAEDLGRSQVRERHVIGLARATAPFAVSCEYVLPLVQVGGVYLAQLGPRDGQALATHFGEGRKTGVESAWAILGAELTQVRRVALPWQQGDRYVATLRKRSITPAKYPRKAGTPARDPLSVPLV